ncbi:hypothetical protein A2872_01270 [Candidatus Gottesmanbacteria bacterium RIFCSPHIGHO2_01_FULL_42_12]|uniref:Uncharacterized protein n=1 Tax=Candidatus Gottesmanbacteria bacterium RIFCSPHIGHO2_01_FULL_42_12 TaxID=1798377 RepID=A0A1F5Z1J8_9BACT|nr:MAG: hypothetical protein A2872_01270 [Candidatus Gottesmanbacteria bacterium RIFCSPHIGHO2_01_FULL_42_12]
MAVELNLLPDKKRDLSPADEGLGKNLQKISFIILFVTVVAGVAVFTIGQGVAFQKADLEKKNTNLVNVITGYREREILLVLLKQKVLGLKTVLTLRPDLAKEMAIIKSSLPLGAQIQGFTGDKSGVINVDLLVDNSETLDRLVTAFSKNNRYSKALVTDLSGNPTDGYKFTLMLTAKEGSWL